MRHTLHSRTAILSEQNTFKYNCWIYHVVMFILIIHLSSNLRCKHVPFSLPFHRLPHGQCLIMSRNADMDTFLLLNNISIFCPCPHIFVSFLRQIKFSIFGSTIHVFDSYYVLPMYHFPAIDISIRIYEFVVNYYFVYYQYRHNKYT